MKSLISGLIGLLVVAGIAAVPDVSEANGGRLAIRQRQRVKIVEEVRVQKVFVPRQRVRIVQEVQAVYVEPVYVAPVYAAPIQIQSYSAPVQVQTYSAPVCEAPL